MKATKPQAIKRGMLFIGGISVTVEIENGDTQQKRTIDLEPITEYRKLSICGSSANWGHGQINETLREALRTGQLAAPPDRLPTLLRLLDIWDEWHLNDCCAGTRFQMDAIKKHEAQHRDCHDSHRGDLYGHRCAVLKTLAPFSVFCFEEMSKQDWADALSGKRDKRQRKLATPENFPTREAAEQYAATIDQERAPIVTGIYADRGYTYGSAWLVNPLPAEIEAELIDILDGKPAHQPPATQPRQWTKEEIETEEVLAKLPKPGQDATFTPVKVATVTLPHPYVITSKSFKKDSMYLDTEAPCGACHKPASAHEQQKTLFIEVPQNRDLNAIPGLHDYLLAVKDAATELGIQGFAFPTAKQRKTA